jgi:putative flippase GtrA
MRFPYNWGEIRSELWRLLRFGGVGVAVTVIYVVLTSTLFRLGWTAVAASLVAHICAAAASYTGHYVISFRSTERHVVALPRFIAFLAVSLLLNAAAMFLMIDQMHWPIWVGVAVVTLLFVGLSYLAGRLWIFRSRQKR